MNKIIIIIEDDKGVNELISLKINECGYETISLFSGTEALEWLKSNKPFLIVLDYGLPDMSGRDFISKLNEMKLSIPFIVSTGQGDERIAVEMMKLGAKDYIIKDINFLDMMSLVIIRVSNEIENERKLNETQELLKQREAYLTAIFDNLPGLMWLKDVEGKFIMANNKFVTTCGKNSFEELKGCNDNDIWPEEFAIKFKIDDKAVILSKKHIRVEETILDNDTKKWFDTSKTPIFDESKNVIGTAGYSMDISERKNYEDKLAKKMEELKYMNSFMVNRELRMVDLKKEINILLEKAGLKKRYD